MSTHHSDTRIETDSLGDIAVPASARWGAQTQRAVVEGMNLVKKHLRKSQDYPQGGIVEKEAPIHVSNVAIFNPETNKADRVGFKVEDGKKVRIFKSTQKAVDA